MRVETVEKARDALENIEVQCQWCKQWTGVSQGQGWIEQGTWWFLIHPRKLNYHFLGLMCPCKSLLAEVRVEEPPNG
jgi:hypothetical protein